MKILITGGAGFIGSHVAEAYIKLNHQVTIIDNLTTGQHRNLPSQAKFIECDINDKNRAEHFAREKVDLVNHHAAQINVRESVANPVDDANTNVIGSLQLLGLSHKYGVKHFIFSSTGGAVYGEQNVFPADEDHPTKPVCPYGVAKLAVEKYMYWYVHEFQMNCTVLRYANAYGPRQNSKGEAGVVAIFCDQMNNGINPTINGDGKQTRDYVYIDDIVRMNINVLDETGFEVFNVGTGVEVDVNSLFASLNRLYDGKFEEKHGPAPLGEQQRSSVSTGKAFDRFGWRPKVAVDEGLKLTAEYFKKLES